MNKQNFTKSFVVMIQMKGLHADKGYMERLWQLVNSDFTDSEFEHACAKITKHENLYGKQPDVHLFYKHKPKTELTTNDKADIACREFIAKVSKYLNSGFITTNDKISFNKNLNDFEKSTLEIFGGVSDLWYQVNREDGYRRSVAKIAGELKAEFMNNCKVELLQRKVERIGSKSKEVNKLIESVANKMEVA